MALLGCGELRIATDGKITSCIDGEDDEIDEITVVQGIQGSLYTSKESDKSAVTGLFSSLRYMLLRLRSYWETTVIRRIKLGL
ncbi:hypothetical protein Tcan_11023 [Toxocara canis]|uniref:Uncharacterized protein n=1 Tax=Toxocara canis TaxID=6265 RepID=A0A0B2W3S2_TOXCA|nr:hypothetical protein Tcan_11023 [Toxocara canis]